MRLNRFNSLCTFLPGMLLFICLLSACGGGGGGGSSGGGGGGNQAPTANAGTDRTVTTGDSVSLNGSGSSDPEGDPLTYIWQKTGGPAVALSGVSTVTATFTAPAVGAGGEDIVFTLTVVDTGGLLDSDTVTIHVDPPGGGGGLAPTANAGADLSVTAGDSVTLDGTASSDPESGSLTYNWSLTSGPAVILVGATTATATFTAPDVSAGGENIVFTLIVADPGGLFDSDTVTVHVDPFIGNRGPVAAATSNGSAVAEDTLVLDGSQSTDPDGDSLVYSWQQTGGTEVTLAGASTATAYATAPTPAGGEEDLKFELTVTDPDGLSSKAAVTVHLSAVATSGPVTTVGLIDAAVADGTITAEKGLTYKVFAAFGDNRLPLTYRGKERDLVDATGIMTEAAQKYESLSVEAKEAIYPFLLPPYVANSWYYLYGRQLPRTGRMGRVTSRTGGVVGAPNWKWLTNGKFKIWYDDDLEVTNADGTTVPFSELAEGVFDAVGGTIWGKLQDLMEKEPLSDAGVNPPALPSPDYGYKPGNMDASGALDIVLAHGMNASGYTHPYKEAPTPTFITLDAVMWPIGDEKTPGLIQIAAHELMHSWQFSYPKKEDPLTYYWVMEATAAWAEDYTYPDANSENRYAAFYLDTARLPADDQTSFRQYGLYTAFSYWTNGDTAKAPPSVVKKIWENAGTMSSIDSVDESTPLPIPIDGLPHQFTSFFERFWTDSLVAAWNRGEDGYFFKKDKLTAGAKVSPNRTTTVMLAGASDKVYFLDDLDGSGTLELPYLSGRYYHFIFTDDTARTVMINDGLRVKLDLMETSDGTMVYSGPPVVPDESNPLVDPVEGAEWRILTKIDGVWSEWRPPMTIPGQSLYGTMPGMVTFCRDAKAERVQELVIVLANSAPDKSIVVKPPATAPLVLVTNQACYGWEGTFTARQEGAYQESTTAHVTWGRVKDVMPQYDPYGTLPPGPFIIKTSAFSTSISGGDGECTYSGSDAWSWSAGGSSSDAPDAGLEMLHQARSGKMYRGYDGSGTAGAHEVTYTITCPDFTGTATTIPSWWKASSDSSVPTVGGDGTTLKGSVQYGDTLYEWDLRAIREN